MTPVARQATSVARPQSRYVCQTCGEAFLRWEGQCRACGAGTRWSRRSSASRPRRDGRASRARPSPAPSADRPRERSARRDVPRLPTGSASSTASSAAASCPGSLVLARRRAGHRQVDAPPPGRGRHRALGGRPGASCTPRARSRPARSACGPARLGLLDGPAGERDRRSSPRRDVGRIVEVARAGAARRCSSSTRSRPRRSTSSTGRPGASARSASRPLRLMELAKGEGIAVVLVGHVTKDGTIAGPEDARAPRRRGADPRGRAVRARCGSLRATKNRFGSTDEVGVFEMGEDGLREVADPARAFLADHARAGAGQRRRADARGQPAAARRGPGARRAGRLRDAAPHGERHRPEPARPAGRGARPAGRHRPRQPRRLRQPRRRPGVDEPGLDLPLALALASSLRDRRSRRGTVAIGEVGLLGELRAGRRPRAPAARGRPARLRARDRAAAPGAVGVAAERPGPARSSRSRRSARRSRRAPRPSGPRRSWRWPSRRC